MISNNMKLDAGRYEQEFKSLNVLLISLARRGGMVQYQSFLANALSEIMPTAVLCASVTPRSLFHPAVEYYALNTGKQSAGTFFRLFSLAGWKHLRTVFQQFQPDLVHIVSAHEWNPLLIASIRRFGVPVVYTVHDPVIRSDTRFDFHMLEKLARRMADGWVGLSQQAGSQLRQQGYPAECIFTCRMGTFQSPHKNHEASIAAEENLFLFFGRIVPYKGLDTLLKAAPAVFAQLPNWRLVIAGSGDLHPYQALLHHPQIDVVNRFLTDEEIHSWMEKAKIIVVPYHEASQSGIIATAFGYGKAIISSDVGSISEIVIAGKNGLLIPPKDPAALSQAMISLATDETQRQLFAQNNARVGLSNLGWESIALEHQKVYQQMFEYQKVHS